ncbi:MAG: Magnesium transporter MgtE [Planctomycetes bacterium]|nr:Magnesium transporter MgtE [Planctomycetota bacterium]
MEPDASDPASVETRELLLSGSDADVRRVLQTLTPQEVADLLEGLPSEDRERVFPLLDTARQASVLREVETDVARDSLISAVPDEKLADIVEHAASDDAVDLVEDIPEERRDRVIASMEAEERAAVEELQQYPPDTAGGLMQKELLRVRAESTVGEAIDRLREHWDPKMGDLFDIYVVDAEERPLGRVRSRHLVLNPPSRRIREIMLGDVRTVPVTMDQEHIAEIVRDYDLASVAVVDEGGRLVGRILVDDIVDVLDEEATEDFQKAGGTEALDGSYLSVPVSQLVRKRVGWLAVLLVGEMGTLSVMAMYEHELAKATVLAFFLPLIISAGGNSGSQATTLVIRAMALGDVTLGDGFRVARREIAAGLVLGLTLALLGAGRVLLWEEIFHAYGTHAPMLALTVGASLLGIVLWGTLAGSMLPFALRRAGLDPASASAPLVATLVDVTGVVIYFTAALTFLRGSLL